MPDDILAAIVTLARDNTDIAALWLYGSRARGTQTESSDYDLAVAFNHFLANEADRRLRPALLAMDWCRHLGLPEHRLSLVDINLVPLPLAVNIIDANRVLLAKDDLRVIRECNRVWGLWSDYQWHQTHNPFHAVAGKA